MLDGLTRKIGLVLAVVTALTWLLFVIGFASSQPDFSGVSAAVGSVFFPHFTISLLGVPTIVLGVVHALDRFTSRSATKIVGTITTFFSVLFLLCLGMILYLNGTRLLSQTGGSNSRSSPGFISLNLEFYGALLSTISWTSVMMMWTFYA
ncbi:uncharacterized protein LOC135337030 [Halichondria panicea]|uniref:uncharacterized protein LOC135337030 n=1 Tax=Halichondria panicea TaxID=6063 RepID=UPI00312B70D8